jgi:hypothetical protein
MLQVAARILLLALPPYALQFSPSRPPHLFAESLDETLDECVTPPEAEQDYDAN